MKHDRHTKKKDKLIISKSINVVQCTETWSGLGDESYFKQVDCSQLNQSLPLIRNHCVPLREFCANSRNFLENYTFAYFFNILQILFSH